jgi:hypothetical protein
MREGGALCPNGVLPGGAFCRRHRVGAISMNRVAFLGLLAALPALGLSMAAAPSVEWNTWMSAYKRGVITKEQWHRHWRLQAKGLA